MSDPLEVSIHGSDKIGLIERIVHACRYQPGLIVIEEDYGRSPVVFLENIAEILRDELDFALVRESFCADQAGILEQLITQWNVYRSDDGQETDFQRIHHYLDICLQSGQMALIAVERAAALSDDVCDLLFNLLSRHSQLSVLLCGIVDSSRFAVRASAAEIAFSLIDFSEVKTQSGGEKSIPEPMSVSSPPPVRPASAGLQLQAELELTIPDGESLFVDDDLSSTSRIGRREMRRPPPVFDGESTLGISKRLSAMTDWAGDTYSRVVKINSPDMGRLAWVIGAICGLSLVVWFLSSWQDRQSDVESQPKAVVISREVGVAPPPVVGVTPVVPPPAPVQPPSTMPGAVASAPVEAVGVPEQPPVVARSEKKLDELAVPPVGTVGAPPSSPERKKAPAAPAEKADNGVHSLAWWKARPGNFTVQIASAHNEANIRRLASGLPARHPQVIYPTRRDGKPWFVLLYGSFASRDEAAQAMEKLPAGIRAEGPAWVRKQGEVIAK